MSDERFDIVFGGELLEGFAPATVADNLARLFKATPETVARLLDGGTHTLKRNVDAATAAKYRSAMERAGSSPRSRSIRASEAANCVGTESLARKSWVTISGTGSRAAAGRSRIMPKPGPRCRLVAYTSQRRRKKDREAERHG